MTDYLALLTAAHAAAASAVAAEVEARPEDPMAFDCGFAWVTVKPATSPFIRAVKKQHTAELANPERTATFNSLEHTYGDKAYTGGWQWWKPGNFSGQSIRIHEVGARAFAKVLIQAGIAAQVGTRLD